MTTTNREKIQEVIGKAEDHFEQKLTYISAGALGLTVTFIGKIIPLSDARSVIFLVIGWGFLVLTLLINLSSHLISKHYLIKTQLELDRDNIPEHFNEIYLRVIQRNKIIDWINWITVVLLILGISSIVTFSSINSIQKSSKSHKIDQHDENDIQSKDSTINYSQININYYYDR